MPTATSTLTEAADSPIPASLLKQKARMVTAQQPSSSSTVPNTLRTLYNRAARAFLLRDIHLTHSLIDSAFTILGAADVSYGLLKDHRRKWDILRITLETTVHSSPPSSREGLPEALMEISIHSSQSLLTSMYLRSLSFFSPGDKKSSNVDPAYLPPQVLTTLVYSSLRLDCPDTGRVMIEDWLSRRGTYSVANLNEDPTDSGYTKILELYCLHILPSLEQWDYAEEFLEYERELSKESRESFKKSLKSIQAEAMTSRQTKVIAHPSNPHSEMTPRSFSPSSSSSSLSTTSTNTVVPSTVRGPQPNHSASNASALDSDSTSSRSSNSAATARQPIRRPVLRSRTVNPSPSPSRNIMSSPRSPIQETTTRPLNLGILALVKASLAPHMTASNISTLFLIFFVLPLVSWSARTRYRRRQEGPGTVGKSADLVRKSLKGSGEARTVVRVWSELVRIVCDAVKMAGSGLI